MEIETKKKKLLYQSLHRGCKEIDVLLGGFASRFIFEFSVDQLNDYESLIDEEDNILYNMLLGKIPAPSHLNNNLVRKIIMFNEERVSKKHNA